MTNPAVRACHRKKKPREACTIPSRGFRIHQHEVPLAKGGEPIIAPAEVFAKCSPFRILRKRL